MEHYTILIGGVTMVQIREKTASTREFLTIAKKAKAITDKVRELK